MMMKYIYEIKAERTSAKRPKLWSFGNVRKSGYH